MKTKNNSQNLHQLFIIKLQALLDVENVLVKALQKMVKKANHQELKSAFEEHLKETMGHVKRLEQSFEILNEKAKKLKVDAIRGLVSDAEWVIKNIKTPSTLDAGLIASAQYVEHYEIAGYGTAIEWAKLMGHDEVADLLNQTLEEEKMADKKLLTLASDTINEEANLQVS